MEYRVKGERTAVHGTKVKKELRTKRLQDGTTKEYHHDIAFDELGDVLDSMIETGGMTKEEYQEKVRNFVCSL